MFETRRRSTPGIRVRLAQQGARKMSKAAIVVHCFPLFYLCAVPKGWQYRIQAPIYLCLCDFQGSLCQMTETRVLSMLTMNWIWMRWMFMDLITTTHLPRTLQHYIISSITSAGTDSLTKIRCQLN